MTSNSVPEITETCTPRDDVKSGRLEGEQFAANLHDVAHTKEAPSVYSDTEKFFRKTYPTKGLQKLLTTLSIRFVHSAKNEDYSEKSSLLSLDTSFGGGKTHNQIACYHLAENPNSISNLSDYIGDLDNELRTVFSKEENEVNTAVIDGSKISAESCRSDLEDPNAFDTNTIWGEIAQQLFGEEGYNVVSENDESYIPPGSQELEELFSLTDNPSLILIDEIAKYLNAAKAKEVTDTNLSDLTNNFLWSLYQYCTNSDDVTVVMSMSDTTFESDAEEARDTIENLKSINGRLEEPINPTRDDEISTVLQSRIFSEIGDDVAELVADKYGELYDENRDKTLSQSKEEYKEDIRRYYPIHPSTVRLLKDEVDQLSGFQRTRDGIKILSRAVHKIWNGNHTHDRHFVRIYDMHPRRQTIRSKLRDLFNDINKDFDPAIKADIYNPNGVANAQKVDQKWIEDDIAPTATHLTVVALWKSIINKQGGRGVTRAELNSMLMHPQIDLSYYDKTLKRLTDIGSGCYYLTENGKIKIMAEPDITKLIKNVASEVSETSVYDKLRRTVEKCSGSGVMDIQFGRFGEEEYISDSSDQVVLFIEHPRREMNEKNIPDHIVDLHSNSSASTNRTYRNNVLFLLPSDTDSSKEIAKDVIAMEKIINDKNNQYDVSESDIDEIESRLEGKKADLLQAVKKCYNKFVFPTGEGLESEEISPTLLDGDRLHDVVMTHMKDHSMALTRNSDPKGNIWMKKKIWSTNKNRISANKMEEQFAKRPELDILLHPRPVKQIIKNCVQKEQNIVDAYIVWDDKKEIAYMNSENAEQIPFSTSESSNILIEQPSSVAISENTVIYKTVSKLLGEHEDTIEPPVCSDCGEYDYECVCEAKCKECGKSIIDNNSSGLCSDCDVEQKFPDEKYKEQTSRAKPDDAFSQMNQLIGEAVQRYKDEYGYNGDPSYEVAQIQLRLAGDQDKWRRAQKASVAVDNRTDNIGKENCTVSAEQKVDDSDGFNIEFSSSMPVSMFADNMKKNPIPKSILESSEHSTDFKMTIKSDKQDIDIFDELEEALSGENNIGKIQLVASIKVEPSDSVIIT